MSERLPPPESDSPNYERPNQKWTCGHAAEGKPCRLGPDHRGRCQTTSECVPVLETKPGETKGRWRCTRPGGSCESGPLPDGRCCRPVARCSPVPTLRTWRGRITRAVVAATCAALLIVAGSPPLRNRFFNPGGLSTAHSGEAFAKFHGDTNRIDHTCAACHSVGAAGLSGIVDAAWKSSPGPLDLKALVDTGHAEMTTIDGACLKCHTHHLLHQPNTVRDLSCSFCHAEHRGSGPMALPTDAHCARCHGDAAVMAAAAEKGSKLPATQFEKVNASSPRPPEGYTKVIHSFAGDHPEFQVLAGKATDSNTLRFGHALHLTGDTIPQLPGGKKLDCAYCHQPDATGAYFRPVNFQNNCQVCHSLQFDPEAPGLTLPHGDPNHVIAFLHSLPKQYSDYAARSGITQPEAQRQYVQEKLQRLQTRMVAGEDLEKSVFFNRSGSGPMTQVGAVSGATRALYPGCASCHDVKAGSDGRPEMTLPQMPARWLWHGRFDHSKHARMACTECHPASQSKSTADIILPGKDSCASCHSPRGGAKDSCITCHQYHRM
jgi:hypothetical protein